MTTLQKLIQYIERNKKEIRSGGTTSGTVEIPQKVAERIERNLASGTAYAGIRSSNSVNLYH